MKSLLILAFLFTSLFLGHSYAGPVIINGEYRFLIKNVKLVNGFDYQYQFFTDHPEERLVLDCQSFIQNITFYWSEDRQFEEVVGGMLLSPGECQFIAYNVFALRSQNHPICLKIIPETYSIKIGDGSSLCYSIESRD